MSGLILPNRPKVTRETKEIRKSDNDRVSKADHHLRIAGDTLTPAGMVYVGTAATHIYADPKNPRSFAHIEHTPVGSAHEVWVDQAMRALKDRLMTIFGRKIPELVKR